MQQTLDELAAEAKARVSIEPEDIVLDIGCNDGYLLSHFRDCHAIGFDPSNIEGEYGTVIKDFFTATAYEEMELPKAKVVFSIAVLYDLDDPNSFVRDVKAVLAEGGLWVIQMNDIASMVARSAYDFIGHEHVCVYSLEGLARLLARYDLQIIDAEHNGVNGGSLRAFVTHKHSDELITQGAYRASRWEKGVLEAQSSFAAGMIGWGVRAAEKIMALNEIVQREADHGARIHIYGASTRGCTIWQSAKINEQMVDMAAEKDRTKVGYLVPGLKVPIVSEEFSRLHKPDYYLVGPYSFMEVFWQREKEFLDRGGKFIVPLPTPMIQGKQ